MREPLFFCAMRFCSCAHVENVQNMSKTFLLLLPNIYIFFKLIGI